MMNTLRTGSMRAAGLGVLLTIAAAAPAAAQTTRIWKGPSSRTWSTPANWDPVGAPVDGDSLIFDGTGSNYSVNDQSDITIEAITVTSQILLTGSAFRLTSGVTSSALLAILNVVTLAGDQTWTATTQRIVPTHVILNGHEWTVDIVADTLQAGLISGAGSIVKSGVGTLQMTDDNTFSGPVTIDAGRVLVNTANGLGVGDGTPANGTTVNAGGRLTVEASGALTLALEALTLQGSGSGQGALEALAPQPITFTGPIALAATTQVWGGLMVSHDRRMIFNGPLQGPGDLVIMADTIVTLAGLGNTLTGVGFAGASTGTIRVGIPNALSTARVNLPAGATLDLNGSSTDVLGLDGAGTVTLGPTLGN